MSHETNCFHIAHYVSSTVVCVVSSVVAVSFMVVGWVYPDGLHYLYKLGGTDVKIVIVSTVTTIVLLSVNVALAWGIMKDLPILLLIWVLVTLILWKLHLILLLCTFIFNLTSSEDKCVKYCSIRLISLVILQVLWLIMLLLVARHWYAICEELYLQEYGSRPRTLSNRLRTISYRHRVSTNYSHRFPHILQRIER